MSAPSRSHFTLAGCRLGAKMALPVFPGYIVFAMAFGTAASQKGLPLTQAMGLSGFVYAGASQMVSLGMWQVSWTLSTLLTLMAVTAVVNARMILLGAALQPWLAKEPLWRSAINLFLVTEATWLIGTHYHQEGGRDVGVLFGLSVLLWIVWFVATVAGYFAGALVPAPERFGLDLVMPVFFGSMLVPLWKGAKPALPWLVAGAVALLVHAFVPGYLYLILGAVSGVIAGMLIE
ncbi:AzlC family ABC transporter permease [Microvirga flavescens]|uniref:AzlC family ABC transporter permease n=1 Tax=Microvirga flavescens TaxID=2249811 RepID=UPI000DD9B800|nr:AzlC family ABC transporter permease [Microvirga flavescens]